MIIQVLFYILVRTYFSIIRNEYDIEMQENRNHISIYIVQIGSK